MTETAAAVSDSTGRATLRPATLREVGAGIVPAPGAAGNAAVWCWLLAVGAFQFACAALAALIVNAAVDSKPRAGAALALSLLTLLGVAVAHLLN
ncbi:MAG TPA: hypothetical protein VK453_25555 [Micromonosporaceae bacterium]|nr:hypothetical protein [Micromonosporaceae bacterium]